MCPTTTETTVSEAPALGHLVNSFQGRKASDQEAALRSSPPSLSPGQSGVDPGITWGTTR
jgi:hypothetical protein